MGLLDSILGTRTTLGPLPITAAKVVEWLDNSSPSLSGARIGPESAMRLSTVYACVRIISEDIAASPLHLYQRLERGKERATNHPLYWLLHNSPNRFMTSMQWRETMQGHMLLRGNAYSEIERDGGGRIVAIWPLRPDRMDPPKLAQDGSLLYHYRLPSGEGHDFAQAQVLHLRGLSPDGLVGYSPIQLQRETLAHASALHEYGNRFFGNNARPGGVLQMERGQKLTPEAATRLRTSWEAAHKGLENSHRVAILEDGVTWQTVGLSPEDSQFIESRKLSRSEIAGEIFRVPLHKIGDLDRATNNNIEEQSISYVSDTLQAWYVRWEQQLALSCLTDAEQRLFFVEHLMDAKLRGKTLERFEGYAAMLLNGVFSPNDVLEKENMNPFDGGDVHLQQVNMVPFGTPPAPPAAPVSIREIRRLPGFGGYTVIDAPVRELSDGK